MVNATIKGTEGRRSSARTARPLKGKVARIRVIGREERTNSEIAQYHLLLLSLTVASASTPLFVDLIWFPKNAKGSKRDKTIYLSCEHAPQILESLNKSQRDIVGAMLSPAPRDSLIIAHGIVTLFNNWPQTEILTQSHRASRNGEDNHNCRSSSDMGIP